MGHGLCPATLSSYNDSQFTSQIFQNVCKILGIEHLFTARPRTSSKIVVKSSDRTKPILPGYATMSNNTTMIWTWIRTFIPFATTFSQRSPSRQRISLYCQPRKIPGESCESHLLHWKMWLSHLVDSNYVHMIWEQKKYNKRFTKKYVLTRSAIKSAPLCPYLVNMSNVAKLFTNEQPS